MSNASLNLVISSEYVWESFLLNLLESAASFTQHHWPHCTVCDLVTCELPQIHILIYYESYGSSVSGGWGEQLFLFYDDSDSFLFFSTTFSFSLQRLLEFLPDNSPSVSCSVMFDSLWSHGLQPSRLLCPWNSPRKNAKMDGYSLLQRIFWPRDQTPACCIAGRFFTLWATREASILQAPLLNSYLKYSVP